MISSEGSEALLAAVTELKALLVRTEVSEATFQAWFEQHPIVFKVLGFRRWLPHLRFPVGDGRFLEPDFMVEDFNGVWSVFELKRHDTSVLKNPERRTDFRADFSTYVQQCREYAKYFEDAAGRRTAEELHNVRIQRDVPSIIVASTDDLTDFSTARELLVDRGNRVELRTYSEIQRTILRQLDLMSIDRARHPGISMTMLGVFPIDSREQVLFDVGKQKDRSRCIIGLRGRDLALTLLDATGRKQRWDVPRPLIVQYANSSPVELLEVEVGASRGSLYVSAYHNRRCVMQQQLPSTVLGFEDLAGGMAMGTDVTGKMASNFALIEAIAYMRTLAPSERIQIYEHLDEVYHYFLSPLAIHRPPTVVFSGNTFMTIRGHPLSTEAARAATDPSKPWGWWISSEGVITSDGKERPRDFRLGARTKLLPGMSSEDSG